MCSSCNIRNQVDNQLQRPLSDDEWHYLVNMGYIREMLEGSRSPVAVAEQVRVLRMTFGVSDEGQSQHYSSIPLTNDMRGRVLANLLAEIADQDSEVQTFRREVLNDTLLAWDDVLPWIQGRCAAEGAQILLAGVMLADDEEERLITTNPSRRRHAS